MASGSQSEISTQSQLHDINTKWVPDGYEEICGPDGETYIVPVFMVAALEQAYQEKMKKDELKVFEASGAVYEDNGLEYDDLGEGLLKSPPVPGSSDRERLAAHSEVLVLQERLGISYKDAAHRLYMAELQRVKTDQKMYKAFTTLLESTEKSLERASNAFKLIKESENQANI